MSRDAAQSASTQSLQRLEDSLRHVKTVLRLVRRQQAVEFSNERLEVDVENWGQVRLRDVVLDTGGTENPKWPGLTSGPVTGSVPQYPGGRPRYRNALDPWNTGVVAHVSLDQIPDSLNVLVLPPTDTDISSESPKSPGEDCLIQPCQQATMLHGKSLPRNINYQQKGRVAAISDTVSVIGPELRDGSLNLTSPTNCAFNPRTRKLLVCDRDNNRVLFMSLDGKNVGVFYRNRAPYDIAISDDGQCVYILTVDPCRIHRVNTHGSNIGSVNTADESYSIVHHNQHVAVLSQKNRSITVYDTSLARVRSFKLNSVPLPHAMAVDCVGNFHITDSRSGGVHVYTWDGGRTLSFGTTLGDPVSPGICVDGDGFVCVSRYHQNRIDVYDGRGGWLVHIGAEARCFQNPEGLHLLPDGRIVVADWKNDRLVIL